MSIDNQLLLMKDYKINAEEWFFLQLLFLAQPDEDKPEYVFDYLTNICLGMPREMLLKFQENGIITKAYKIPEKGETFYPENIIFNKNFLNKYFKYSGELGQELFSKYPSYIIIKGISYSLKNIAKKFNSLEDFFFAYSKSIGHNPSKHLEVMEILDWAKENNLINTNICEFIISRKWIEFSELREAGFTGNNLKIDELI